MFLAKNLKKFLEGEEFQNTWIPK